MKMLLHRDIVVTVDPGLATGLSIFDVTDLNNPVLVGAFELGVEDFFDEIDAIIKEYSADHITIVCENFHITPETAKKTPQPYSLWLIGLLQYLSYKHGTAFVFQNPSDKQFIPDTKEGNSKLRKVGFWLKGGEGHANDSMRHFVVWLCNKNPIWTKNLIL